MSTNLFTELQGGISFPTQSIFFNPRSEFAAWFKEKFKRRLVIDCGAGRALVTKLLREVGMSVIPLDIYPSDLAEVDDILPIAAERFQFVDGMLPILVRPCGGDWIRDTIDAAIKGCGQIVYIGVERNYHRDLTPLPYAKKLLLEDAGDNQEAVWLITEKEQAMAKKEFERVLLIEHHGEEVLVGIKNGNKHWNCGVSRCTFDPEVDKVIKEFPYECDEDLDAILLEVDAKQCPKPTRACARLGWLAPDGKFFPCAYCAHKSVAGFLCAKYLKKLGGAEDLHKRGWLKIDGQGMIGRGYSYNDDDLLPITAEQIESFRQIVMEWEMAHAEGKNLEQLCISNPEDYPTQFWSTSPANGLLKGFKRHLEELTGEPTNWQKLDDEPIPHGGLIDPYDTINILENDSWDY